MTTKTMRPFLSYYGGKWKGAPRYPRPMYDTIIEPFAGGAGYSIRHHTKQVVLYDLDPVLAGVWSYLITADPQRILSLPDFEDGQTVDDLHGLCQEERWLIGFWVNKGGASPAKSPSAWMRSRPGDGQFWGDKLRHRFAEQVQHIRHWRVEQASYADIETPEATWYIDPPYQDKGKHYKCGSADIDYQHLGEWCKSLRGQVIVCEGPGADWLPFEKFMDIKAANGRNRANYSSEYIWIGGNQ